MSSTLSNFELYMDGDKLSLRSQHLPKAHPLVVDFLSGSMRYRQRSNATKNQLLARAVGLRKTPLKIFDATLGLGTDAFLLATLGCQVRGIEQNETVFKLVQDGFRRAMASLEFSESLKGRVTVENANSELVLAKLSVSELPDVIYIDPMFPKSRKAALASKEMQILQALLGSDESAAERLLAISLSLPVRRVVVKRPLKSSPLIREPNNRISGTTVRFDVYF